MSRSRAFVVLPAIGVVCLVSARWSLLAQSGDLPTITSVDTGSPPQRIAVGAGAVWVSNLVEFNPGAPVPGLLSRIDPTTMQIVSTVPVGKAPDGIAIGFGSVWVGNSGDLSVSRVNPLTNGVEATIPLQHLAKYVAIDAAAVWVAGGSELTRLDPRSNRVVGTLRLGNVDGLAIGDQAVWVLDGHITQPGPA
jgi:streptogramin lyase